MSEADSYSFFSVEDYDAKEEKTDDGAVLQAEFELSDKMYTYERQAYTMLALVGDVGGFNGALILLQGFVMSFYSSILFEQ
mmetsp:Transcript_35174/g.46334  ORF Transcript_35174/g.46334 Transcript_35174/m.46334 type:complete len:81 (-) Transcript_35174:923-1165(-)